MALQADRAAGGGPSPARRKRLRELRRLLLRDLQPNRVDH